MKLRRQHSDMGQPLQQPSTERGGPQSNSNERSLKDLQASGQRRRLRTAGNPIGIMDQSERYSLRRHSHNRERNMGYKSGSFAAPTSSGGDVLKPHAGSRRGMRKPPLHGSQSGATMATSQQQTRGGTALGSLRHGASSGPFRWQKGAAGRVAEGEMASSASSLPHMGSHRSTANIDATSNAPVMSSYNLKA